MMNTLVFIYGLIGNYGVAILIFTVLIKLVTLPFSLQQQKAMKKQQAVQPELQALQKKYGKDKQRYQQEMMKLYKEKGINPLGGCLPMLIPWPLFLAFYQSVSSLMSTQPEQFLSLSQHILPALATLVPVKEGFLWLNLSRPDPIYILPVLSVVTTWLQQKMMAMPSTDPQASSMNQTMGIFMPLFMGYITMSFASGLAIYWVMFNVVGIIQQYFVTGWGDLAKVMPKPILRILPGPASAQVMLPAVTAEPEKSAESRPKRRARVDGDGQEPRPSRRSAAPVAPPAGEVKLPRRRSAEAALSESVTPAVSRLSPPATGASADGRKVRRKTPPQA
jgi:YidC/Oxa1 family membrane protein insertase